MAPSAEILIFEVDGQRHALPVTQVRNLLPAQWITPVPGTSPGIEGVINLRGVIVPVLSVRHRFGLPVMPLSPADHFIVAALEERLVVLHVDRTLELVRLDADAIVQPDLLRSTDTALPRMVKYAGSLVALHDLRDFLPPGGSAAGLTGPPAEKEERR